MGKGWCTVVRLSKIQKVRELINFLGGVSSNDLVGFFPGWPVKDLQGAMDWLESQGEVRKSRMNKGQGSFLYSLKVEKEKEKKRDIEKKVGPPIVGELPRKPFTTAEKAPVIRAVYELDGEFTAADLHKEVQKTGRLSAEKLKRMIPQLVDEEVLVAIKSYQNRYGRMCNVYERGDKDD